MKAEELRIGNYVESTKFLFTFVETDLLIR